MITAMHATQSPIDARLSAAYALYLAAIARRSPVEIRSALASLQAAEERAEVHATLERIERRILDRVRENAQ